MPPYASTLRPDPPPRPSASTLGVTPQFLTFMFVAIFIMLSMFFAILGENQSTLRDEQHEARKLGELGSGEGYGALSKAWDYFRHGLLKVCTH